MRRAGRLDKEICLGIPNERFVVVEHSSSQLITVQQISERYKFIISSLYSFVKIHMLGFNWPLQSIINHYQWKSDSRPWFQVSINFNFVAIKLRPIVQPYCLSFGSRWKSCQIFRLIVMLSTMWCITTCWELYWIKSRIITTKAADFRMVWDEYDLPVSFLSISIAQQRDQIL